MENLGPRRQQPSRLVPVSVYGIKEEEVFQVEERYSNLKVIGAGSYGVVCSAIDTSTDAKVAIKKIKNALEDQVDAGRVLRELRLLRHIGGRENTLKIIDTYTYPPDTPDFADVYIVTELWETDLDRVLRSSQELMPQHFAYFSYQLLRSVANMHRACVLHRDLKPSNLLVNANCDLVVCDFGLARGVSTTAKQPPNTARPDGRRSDIQSDTTDVETNDHLTEYVVTRWYRPPEILAESPYYGAAADIWSVGCILGEMLDVNRRPIFQGSSPQNQMSLIIAALGSPTEEELTFCTSTSARGVIRRICRTLESDNIAPWNFEERFPLADPSALDLLRKMLVMDPKKRITAEEALHHPFLRDIHTNWRRMENIAKFDFSFEKVHHESCSDRIIPTQHLQNLFLHEVNKYRIVQCRIRTPLHLKNSARLKRNKKPAELGQRLQLRRSKSSNQEFVHDNITSLPVISNTNHASSGKGLTNKSKTETSNEVRNKYSGKTDRLGKFRQKIHPATVVPSSIIREDKLSKSLTPLEDKDQMLSRLKKKSASSSALSRKQPSNELKTSSLRRAFARNILS